MKIINNMKTAILVLVVLFIVLDIVIYFLHKNKKKEIKDEEDCPPKPLSREEKLEHENTEYTFGHNIHHHYIDGDGNNLT